MKKIFLLIFLSSIFLVKAQFFGDTNKSLLQVGPTFANDNIGLYFAYEEQLGKYISVGLNPVLLLQKQTYTTSDGVEKELKFGDRFDLKAKMSIHFSEVLKIEKFDFYPGLNLGLHNLGFHTGIQFYLAEGFAAFAEMNIAIAKYKEDTFTSFNKGYFSGGLSIDL